VVPLGSAPAGTVIASVDPPEVCETIVDVVLDVVTEVGVPNDDAGTVVLVGAGALVGPVVGVGVVGADGSPLAACAKVTVLAEELATL
jgi:hypothetical protein